MSALTVAIWGKPDQICSMRGFLRMTPKRSFVDSSPRLPWSVLMASALCRGGVSVTYILRSAAGLKYGGEESLTLRFLRGKEACKEANWLTTVPGKGFFTVLRLYGPSEAFLNPGWCESACGTRVNWPRDRHGCRAQEASPQAPNVCNFSASRLSRCGIRAATGL
jgi:hypothetical protein